MVRLKLLAALPFFLAVAACEPEPVAPEPPPAKPSAAQCEQLRSALREQGRKGGFLFEDRGTAMIEQARWFTMSETARGALFRSLAMLAQCASDQPQREIEVTIRNDVGAVIATRTVGF